MTQFLIYLLGNSVYFYTVLRMRWVFNSEQSDRKCTDTHTKIEIEIKVEYIVRIFHAVEFSTSIVPGNSIAKLSVTIFISNDNCRW